MVSELAPGSNAGTDMLATFDRATGSAHAGSSFFTRFTRLLTSYYRISAGSNGFSRSQMASAFWKPGSSRMSKASLGRMMGMPFRPQQLVVRSQRLRHDD